MLDNASIGIKKVERHTTELGTRAAIGRALEAVLRGIALTTVADAESAVYKDLELHIGHLTVNISNLADRELARQHHLTEPQFAEPTHLLGRAVVCLRGSVEMQMRRER